MSQPDKDVGRRIAALESPTAVFPVGKSNSPVGEYDGDFDPLSDEAGADPVGGLLPEAGGIGFNPLVAAAVLLVGAFLLLTVSVALASYLFYIGGL